jgi:hypothetical protein
MSKIVEEVTAANRSYASNFGDKGKLPLPPGRGFAILTCMDARLDPAKYAGLAEGDAHVIRNAGGRATDDAIRSLVISYKLLGPRNGSSFTIPTAAWSCLHHKAFRWLGDENLSDPRRGPSRPQCDLAQPVAFARRMLS